jgi:hypothetical protein
VLAKDQADAAVDAFDQALSAVGTSRPSGS